MFHRSCALCKQQDVAAANLRLPETGVNLGPLLGPILDRKNPSSDEMYVHRLCALWSSEVYETDNGMLRNVLAAIKRGRQMRCSHCGQRGATVGCRVPSCNCTYHVACAKEGGCTYYCEQFQIACPTHAPSFVQQAREQSRPHPFTPYRGPPVHERPGDDGLAAGGRGGGGGSGGQGDHATPGGDAAVDASADLVSPPTELPTFLGRKRGRRHEAARQHILQAKAAMKRARRELERQRKRAAEPESSDDDEHFQKKEQRRLDRDTAKLNPITLMGDGTAVQHVFVSSPAQGPGGRGAEGRQPLAQHHSQQQQRPTVETAVVGSIAATDFSSVAGLDDVVRQLREMVLLPMQYPQLFEGMGLRPPRGILFHGVPGTGKTLVARALAGACAKHSPRPVTFFARKGADCLGKFHGEAERTLRLLFEEASRRAPAIIFLDELDALVPARAARAGGSDQIYASVVSTLLSLMDGVTDRGDVIVIGATNRPEAIDPALRRPGRFDREVYFGLPTPTQRLAILRVHTCRWTPPPPEDLLQQVALRAEGFAGADLQSLCTAAVMAAVRRSAPLLLEAAEREAEATAAAAAVGGGGGGGGSQQALLLDRGGLQPQRDGALVVAAAGKDGGAQPAPEQQQQQQGQGQQHVEGQQGQEVVVAAAGARAGQLSQARQQLLESVAVQECDWLVALGVAPPPCSRRHGMAALTAEMAAPLPQHALPLLARPLLQLLSALHAAALPLPPPAAAAAQAAAAALRPSPQTIGSGAQAAADLEAVMLQHGALVAPASGGATPTAASAAADLAATRQQQQAREAEEASQKLGRSYPPCRLLLWGEGEQGQEAAAGAVLKLLEGCPVHCLSLPSLVAAGGGDPRVGCVSLVGEALRRASPHTPCVFYLPRLESWALAKVRLAAEDMQVEGAGPGAGSLLRLPPGGANGGGSGGTRGEGAGEGCRREGSGAAPSEWRSMLSPSFGSKAASPLHHHGFLLAPSPFSGLLPLDERVSRTPAVARALRSAAQLHRQQEQQQQGRYSFGPGDADGNGALDEGPSLQERCQQAAAVVAPPSGLPPIRTASLPSPAAAGHASGVGGGTGSGGGGVEEGEQEEEEEEEGLEVEVEAVCLSKAWSVFECMLRQVPANQPLIVLATCHAAEDGTPANLPQFFAGPAATTAVAAQQAQQAQQGLGETEDAEPAASAVAAPGIARIPKPSGTAWQRAAAAAAEQVTATVASHAALLLHQRMSAAASSAAEQGQGEEEAAQGGGTAAGNSVAGSIQLPDRRRQAAQQRHGQQQHHGLAELQCNTAELERGLRLFSQLLSFQQHLGSALKKEQQGMAAVSCLSPRRLQRPGSGGGHGQRRSGGGAARQPSFLLIAERCQQGDYDSPDAVQADAAVAAAAILAEAHEEQERQRRRQQLPGPLSPGSRQQAWDAGAAVTAACSLQDKIDASCYDARQCLGLADPDNARVLAAAAAHVRRLQAQQRAAEEEAARQQQRQAEQQAAEAAAQEQERQQEAEEEARQQEQEQQQQQERQEEAQQEQGQGPTAEEPERQHAQQQQQQELWDGVGVQEGPEDEQQQQQAGQHAQHASEEGMDVGAGAALREAEAGVAEAANDDATKQPAEEPEESRQQQQQQQEAVPQAGVDADAATVAASTRQEQVRQQQEQQLQAVHLLSQQLAQLLLPVIQQAVPQVQPAAEGSAWKALHEWAGQLGSAAAAACREAVAEAPVAELLVEGGDVSAADGAAVDTAAWQTRVRALADSCAAAARAAATAAGLLH